MGGGLRPNAAIVPPKLTALNLSFTTSAGNPLHELPLSTGQPLQHPPAAQTQHDSRCPRCLACVAWWLPCGASLAASMDAIVLLAGLQAWNAGSGLQTERGTHRLARSHVATRWQRPRHRHVGVTGHRGQADDDASQQPDQDQHAGNRSGHTAHMPRQLGAAAAQQAGRARRRGLLAGLGLCGVTKGGVRGIERGTVAVGRGERWPRRWLPAAAAHPRGGTWCGAA